jgi:transcriptional regulator with XRE-family HTH domain
MDAGKWIRAARRSRILSQRELAEFTGVPLSTIARAESGAHTPRLTTFADLMESLGYDLLLVDWRGRVLEVDEDRERMREPSGRRFPAHLRAGRTPAFPDGWWGYYSVAWDTKDAPAYTYWRRRRAELFRIGENHGYNELWSDAT